jgi:glycosyltransferase involved in cell wall biosynthesis
MKLSIVVPVFNEAGTLPEVLRQVRAAPFDKEILVIDDGSSDNTWEVLQSLQDGDLRLFRHEVNRGKGAALQTGFEHVTGDVVIVQDADLEYDPRDYPKLIRPIEEGKADVVFGSRFIGEPHRVLFFWHYVGNKLLTTLSNMFTNLNLTDMETGYKAFRSEVLQGLRLRAERFGFEPEFTAKVARKKYRIYETAISYSGRGYEEGKKITWRDWVAAVWYIIRFRFFD